MTFCANAEGARKDAAAARKKACIRRVWIKRITDRLRTSPNTNGLSAAIAAAGAIFREIREQHTPHSPAKMKIQNNPNVLSSYSALPPVLFTDFRNPSFAQSRADTESWTGRTIRCVRRVT